MRRVTRRAFLGRAALACAVAQAGCSASGRSNPAPTPEILVDRADDLFDSPWSIRLRGLPPASRVEVMATLTGWGHAPWRSWAAFETDAAGEVDLATAPALGGTYRGNSPMGLFWSMQRQEDELAGPMIPLTGAFPLTLVAGGRGGSRAEITLDRRLASVGVTSRAVSENGVVGSLFTPASPGPHPAVIVLSGSMGGLWLSAAALLASRGYAALALGYLRMPGLPRGLVNIPIEYFEAAIEWLRETVRPRESFVAVIGASRGGELALLLGASIREISAVVAYVPSGVMLGPFGWAEPGDHRPVTAWTHRGRPLPHLAQNNRTVDWSVIEQKRTPLVEAPVYLTMLRDRDAVERASIPVERTRGSVLLISGKADDQWPSFDLAQIAYRRLQGNRHPYPFAHLSYEGAGHGITFPYTPTTVTSYVHPVDGKTYSLGGDPAMTAHASADSWPKVLAFLRDAWVKPR
jgi:dienelactone hydrolase